MRRSFPDPVHRKSSPPVADADAIAIEILGFLAGDDERLDRFLAVTGLDVQTLRMAASAGGFAESMLDYLTADEALLVAFAETKGYDPGEFERLRTSLSPPAKDF